MGTLSIELFEKSGRPEGLADYRLGHEAATGAFGVTLAAEEWLGDPPETVHVILARRAATGEPVGGARLHLRTSANRLPSESHLGDPALTRRIEARLPLRPCEAAGIWVAPAERHGGLFAELFSSVLAAALVHRAGWLLGSTHRKLLPFYRSFGGVFDESRAYSWPDDRYQTYVGHLDLRVALADRTPLRRALEVARERFALGQRHYVRLDKTPARLPAVRAVAAAPPDGRQSA